MTARYNPFTSFLALLGAAGLTPEPEVLTIITRNATFSFRLLGIESSEQALELYHDVCEG
jgi:hypothetical protein